ncbi:galactosyldiacylglycerol synthase [Paenibacillus alkaliterrae]|uniref:MGDG synthase family glycosyltransferase n=1 Tax=Paenibacillus alkaliterrae TaxID=320909 RepID=UPI001F319A80|nr:glycosyltransferase [Paenibacillus alkaliterrae]MCF2937133.1 galactosyldiacylglycerol synthase [Paenibacillus alkaliterrae]
MQKKILIFSEAFGSGHTKAAEALAHSISIQEPSVHTEIIEIGKKLHPITSNLIFRTYMQMITRCPYVWKKIYRNLSQQMQATPSWLQLLIYQLFHRNIERVLEQSKPDLVICTHPFISSSLSRLKKMGYPVNMCTVITDFHAHLVWIQHEVDLYMVSSDDVRRQLIDSGISKHRIAVTGIPVHSNYWSRESKLDVRNTLNLKNIPTVLVMGGGEGLGGIKQIAHSLIKWKERIQLFICTGYNDSLKVSLERNKQFQHPNIKIVGFVDIIDKLLDASDLLITKPGGLTCFEALSKGVPMLIYQPIPGHEEYNCNHLVKLNLALRIHHWKEVDDWIEKLLCFPESFDQFYKHIEQFQQKMNPLAGAKAIMDLLFHHEVTEISYEKRRGIHV